MQALTPNTFERDGFVVLRGIVTPEQCAAVRAAAAQAMDPLLGPVEFEADVGYPGSPESRLAPGGATPRRLLHAYSRAGVLRALASEQRVGSAIEQIIGAPALLSQCHHNCIMTKHPGFSSATLWHQDIRYWSFDRPELISAWFAIGAETRKNGALRVIPGSHTLDIDRGRFDRDLFLRPELAENRKLIRRAEAVELEAGDVLLFHCKLFHAAGRNLSDEVKVSVVYTYHAEANAAIPGTRSAQYESVAVF